MKIRFGPAGIPLSCKGRTVLDGIVDVRKLDLDVMEIQMLRPDEDIGDAEKIRKASKDNNIRLFVHAPYYTNLTGSRNKVEKSMELIKESGVFASRAGAEILVIHPGMYYKSKKASMGTVVTNLRRLRDSFSKRKLKCKIGIETSGKQALFGSIDEVVKVCKRAKGIIPVINFAHIHARCNGCLKRLEDFQEIFDKLKPLKLKSYYVQFSGVVYENGNEVDLTPIKKGNIKFDPLAECILNNKYNITITSASPLLEHDAHYMKLILDRVKEKVFKKKPVVKKIEKKPVKKPKKVMIKKKAGKKKIIKKKPKRMKKLKKVSKKPKITKKKMKKPKKVLKKKKIIKKKKVKKVGKKRKVEPKILRRKPVKKVAAKKGVKKVKKKVKKPKKVLKKKKIIKKKKVKKMRKKVVKKPKEIKKTRLALMHEAYEKKKRRYEKRKKAGKR